jgi:hypothetical protein
MFSPLSINVCLMGIASVGWGFMSFQMTTRKLYSWGRKPHETMTVSLTHLYLSTSSSHGNILYGLRASSSYSQSDCRPMWNSHLISQNVAG